METQDLKVVREAKREIPRDVLEALPRQIDARKVQGWEAEFGLAMTMDVIHGHIRKVLPFKIGYERNVLYTAIINYSGLIPDAALAKYEAAKKAGMRYFYIAEPRYSIRPSEDPWLIAPFEKIIDGVGLRPSEEGIKAIVLAYWE